MGKEAIRNEMKNEVLSNIAKFLREHYETEVEKVSTSEIMMPGIDKDGNEFYYVVKVTIPRGKRNGNGGYTEYNGYDAAETYKRDCEIEAQEKALKAANKEREAKLKAAKKEAKQVKKAVENLEKAVEDYNKKG